MATIPLGMQAYKRAYAGMPEIKLVNRFMETAPTNLKEKVALLARAGTSEVDTFSPDTAAGVNRANFTQEGLFDDALFVVEGGNLWRKDVDGTKTHISGFVQGTGTTSEAWMKGIGYEYMFIADGRNLQYYDGGSHAVGTLTSTNLAVTNQVIQIDGIYYGWNAAVDTSAPDGTASHPFLAAPGTDPITAMANMLNYAGTPGVDFSTAITGPAPNVTANTSSDGPPPTQLIVTSNSVYAAGNAITTAVASGADLSWSGTTLAGGDVHQLVFVPMPNGYGALCVSQVSSYVLVGVSQSQEFFWLNPGETTIDPLDFASKESAPDNIVSMQEVGDQVIIVGQGSTENWYASGDLTAPFVPQEGRVFRRGVIPGTDAVVKDTLVVVGNDYVVYAIGYGFGDTSQWGVHRISTHGIEERIRIQIRSEQGLS